MFQRLAEQIGDIAIFAVVSLIFGIVRITMMAEEKNIRMYLVSLVFSVPVGTLMGALALEWGFGDYASMAAASVGSLLAHDILTGIMNNRVFLGSLLKRAAENLTDKITK